MRHHLNLSVFVIVAFTSACADNVMNVTARGQRLTYSIKSNWFTMAGHMTFVDDSLATPEPSMMYFVQRGRTYIFTPTTVGMFQEVQGSKGSSILVPLSEVDAASMWGMIETFFMQKVRPAYVSGNSSVHSASFFSDRLDQRLRTAQLTSTAQN